ncbi:MAG: NAD-dependent epimerase [Cyclobacteriaceae bacterium]|nr:NAD-dependent epimerase [Cyclobacteriaceae bacterium]
MPLASVLVTGAAGFIGFHLSLKLMESGYEVSGLDNLNDYYDVNLKTNRLDNLKKNPLFTFFKASLEDKGHIQKVFESKAFDYVVHLAAQAGVRYSLVNPHAYTESNITGFLNILEGCRHFKVKHLVYASSSSVYGGNERMPFSESQNVDHPLSLYAATKKANELMAHTYAHLYNIPVTGLRFFTVYGPWGRPDMALFLFTRAILAGEPIDVFNHGKMKRDFTYVDDIVEGVFRIMTQIPQGWQAAVDQPRFVPDDHPALSNAPYRVFNIGNNNPVELMDFIEAIEKKTGRKAIKNFMPLQDGDVPATYADVSSLSDAVGFKPSTSIDYGVGQFIDWYRSYYNV